MDWKSIIADLQECGYTQPELAKKCGCAQPTISDLARGKTAQPGFVIGERLAALHKKALAAKAKKAKAH